MNIIKTTDNEKCLGPVTWLIDMFSDTFSEVNGWVIYMQRLIFLAFTKTKILQGR